MLNIPWFDNDDITSFPTVGSALVHPDGLLAAGGNLSVQTLKLAYENGVFPWFSEGQPIMWWSPSERAVIFTRDIHVAKNMKKLIRQHRYHLTADQRFSHVMQACAAPQPKSAQRESTWITEAMQRAYRHLFKAGIAHSVEVWNADEQLVGGLYGVFVKNCFCGESMFCREANTSKLALIALANFLHDYDCHWIDCQLPTAHLSSLGAVSMGRENFVQGLSEMDANCLLNQRNWRALWQH